MTEDEYKIVEEKGRHIGEIIVRQVSFITEDGTLVFIKTVTPRLSKDEKKDG